jgi:hypothetical protein
MPSSSPQLQVTPSTMEVDFDKNITKLYQAITSCNWDEAVRIAKAHPTQARTWVVRHYEEEEDDDEDEAPEIMWRFLPIHSACARQPPSSVISALLQAYPDGSKCIDDQGMYALHYACGNQASREVVRLLLQAFPEASKLKDPRGMLPIHYLACWGPSSVSVIDMVLVANRDLASAADDDGNTPLDLAADGDYAEKGAVVQALKRWLENGSAGGGGGGASMSSRSSTGSPAAPPPKSTKSTTTRLQIDTSTATEENNGSQQRQNQNQQQQQQPLSPLSPNNNNYNNYKASADAGHMASPKTVGRLRQEISKLKTECKKMDTTWEDKLQNEKGSWEKNILAMEERMKELELESDHGNRQIAELQNDLQVKDAEMKVQHDKFTKKSNLMNDRIGSLNASLYSMMEQQTVVLDALKARESQLQSISNLRQTKMEELIFMEQESEQPEISDLRSCLMKQTKEMEAISAVIAAVRC